MKMQLERTPQEKAVTASNKAQYLILKIEEIKTFMNTLESHQNDLRLIGEQVNECRINTQIGRDAVKSISIDIDILEIQLMDLLDQCQDQIETFNHWFKWCADTSYFDSFGGALALRNKADEIHARINSIMS
jgi:hypothetical protein